MKVALVGAELEENIGIRYMASSLEQVGIETHIVPFNSQAEISSVVEKIIQTDPQIAALSMVFTGRAREFCNLAQRLRDAGYKGHIVAGGHFASFNYERLLKDFPAFSSVGLGEGELLLCKLAQSLDRLEDVPGLAFRGTDGTIRCSPGIKQENLDALPFPKRTTFNKYFDKPIAGILSSRGCWRNCAFCSINAWYEHQGGNKFRVRSIKNIVAEMKQLYFEYGIRIFNFHDDNFFLADNQQTLQRFKELRDELKRNGVEKIAIAVKARPDSITRESISVLDELGLFRVFLGVENASENGLRNLNRKQTIGDILNALQILNDFDVHVAFNFLMFELDATMNDLLINLRFMERHIENPFNFCRAEAYAGTGLEEKLRTQGRLLGDYFGFDYRIKDPKVEMFHKIANYAFFDRNFNDNGLHYFNMQVDFYYQILRRFHPEILSQSLRAAVRNFIKETNLDTFEELSAIFDFVSEVNVEDELKIHRFAREMRQRIDRRSAVLLVKGDRIINYLEKAYRNGGLDTQTILNDDVMESSNLTTGGSNVGLETSYSFQGRNPDEILNMIAIGQNYLPYDEFKKRIRNL
ncbi:MAG: B12-binding domain-containing radical SAM protein [Candidatus Bathyarchaeia archaeon]